MENKKSNIDPQSQPKAKQGYPHLSTLCKIIWKCVFFLTGSALKVLSVGDGKIPTKKMKVSVKTSYFLCEIPFQGGTS